MAQRILYAEDDERMRFLVSNFLKKKEFQVDAVEDGQEALDRFYAWPHFDLVILDVMMPHLSGMEVAAALREESDVPIIMLTALGDEQNEVLGLRGGADDYIAKPFSYDVLLSRIEAQLRRKKKRDEEILSQGSLRVYADRHLVLDEEKEIELSPNEYLLLLYFLRHKGQALSRDQILSGVWGDEFEGDWRNVDTHVKRLRSRLGKRGRHIKTIYGYGYRWEDKE